MARPAAQIEFPANSNVVSLRLSFLPRHREYLLRWLQAGASMGLCDVDVSPRAASNREPVTLEHVLVWVRENADPAYMIRPEGMRWLVIDHVRNHKLGSFASFEAALYCIRPVLSCGAIAAA
ncbi:hypothetical protein [Lichenicoccus sp.]|uniref:hypothetical protein n=1 Tax=Lichenicoccus sp. TaxID=2781899 RepID=UPI003D0CE5D7